MTPFATAGVDTASAEPAPDGSTARPLLALPGASLARFDLAAGAVARAVAHRSVDELWYVIAGEGALWRRQDGREEIVALAPGVAVSLPRGTAFQFRAGATSALAVVGVTLPPWPGAGEVVAAAGPWTPTLG